jgi:hypothetical protein
MYRQMPMYNRNQDAFLQQMYDWHTVMAQYEEQLRSFHLERANQFQKLLEEKQNTMVGNGTV